MFLGFLLSKNQAKGDKTSLGNILVDMGYITSEQLEEAIKIQKSQKLLGEVLVDEMKAITSDQLDEALFEQQLRRKKIRRDEILKLHAKRRRRLLIRVDESAKRLSEASEQVAVRMSEGLVLLQTKVGER